VNDDVGPNSKEPTYLRLQFQYFEVQYNGEVYELPDLFVHQVDVVNGAVMNISVSVVAPDLPTQPL
jgi:hypothetical protein